ncbi:very long chain fatty acid elongase AAEL008004-like isoform X1 [Tenebrio molitor]|uniref:very long chain fatty acid elongase AAEL008004-like isoform X1 n=1 Tax=Tenebrio molitor TaxID=7067 RepID=UPI00362471E2
MAQILNVISNVNNLFDAYGEMSFADPRVAQWYMMSSPTLTIIIVLLYIYFVKFLGPHLMKNRKPFQLKKAILVYNLLQVLLSTYIFYEIGMSGWFTGEYSLRCQPVDYSNEPSALRMLHAAKWYYIAKFIDLIDTIFFVLRKKFSHVSTLHVIHHSVMPMSIWFGLRMAAGGHSSFFGLLNSFVHMVMYSYYFLSALGPQIQKYLWWKKYLTGLQIVQFIFVTVHEFQLLFIDCNYPKTFAWMIGLHGTLFLFLFKNFYNETYKKKKQIDMKSK